MQERKLSAVMPGAFGGVAGFENSINFFKGSCDSLGCKYSLSFGSFLLSQRIRFPNQFFYRIKVI